MWNIDRCLQGPKCFWDMSWGTQGPRELSSWRVGGRKGAVDRCHDESSSHSYWWWTDLGRPVERGCNRIRQLLYIASLYDKGTTLACKFLHKERFFHWYLQQDKTKEILDHAGSIVGLMAMHIKFNCHLTCKHRTSSMLQIWRLMLVMLQLSYR